MLQPFQYDPNEKNRHKFLVQTLIVPDGVTEIQESLVCRFISRATSCHSVWLERVFLYSEISSSFDSIS